MCKPYKIRLVYDIAIPTLNQGWYTNPSHISSQWLREHRHHGVQHHVGLRQIRGRTWTDSRDPGPRIFVSMVVSWDRGEIRAPYKSIYL